MIVEITNPPQSGSDITNIATYENAVDGTFTENDTQYAFDVNSETGVQHRAFDKWNGTTGVIAQIIG